MLSVKHILISALLLTPLTCFGLDNTPPPPPHNMSFPQMMEKMSTEQKKQHLRKKQEFKLKMHALSHQILAEKDSAKAQQLKDRQLEMMLQHEEMRRQHHGQKMRQSRPPQPNR